MKTKKSFTMQEIGAAYNTVELVESFVEGYKSGGDPNETMTAKEAVEVFESLLDMIYMLRNESNGHISDKLQLQDEISSLKRKMNRF